MMPDALLQSHDRPAPPHVLELTAGVAVRRVGVPAAEAAPPPPLLLPAADFCPAWLEHVHGEAHGPVGDLGCWMLPGGTLGGGGIAGADGRSVIARDIAPPYVRGALAADTIDDAPHRPGREVRRVRGAVVGMVTPGYDTFGHWLLDILPRLWTLRETLGPDSEAMPIAVPADLPAYGRAMLAALGVSLERLIVYDPAREILEAEMLILPSLVHDDYRFHPGANRFYDGVVARLCPVRAPQAPRRIFVSRAGWSGGAAAMRRIVNGAEIADLLDALGFVTVHPERLAWRDQVALFAGAGVVVGEHGSAMKNLLFAPSSTAVINLHFLNMTQTGIAALRGQSMMYLDGAVDDVSPDGVLAYRIDPGKLLACVDAAMMASP
ncbi:MAG: glycosyltransferase 61 family protein [Alphaproteobacteria bacterium]|nr:glycosyltransferase 61 family protein [Alphaproteobacteria bacterium]